MNTFSRFPERLQKAIVGRLGWSSLREVQERAGEEILAGKNAIILAPTAGGKTEAAVFPLLANMIQDPPQGLALLYVAPLRALLNNQADRFEDFAEMVGLRRFLWHGDVGSTSRQKFLREPTEILMTTPESLEVMMISQKVDERQLFAHLRAVVIDEIHALAGSDRGAQLLSVLERAIDHSPRDVQRIGLSATVGNPGEILEWIQGTSRREGAVVDPPRSPARRQILVAYRPKEEELAPEAARIARNRKSLFFCQSRKMTEGVAQAMRRHGIHVFVHHSSVSREERAMAEEQFHSSGSSCIVCTSTLELGIDIGDLDRVLQANAPTTVGSFLQRLGRTGRRPQQVPNTFFLCEDVESVLQATALVLLAKQGWVEDVEINRRTWPVLIHQLLSMALASTDGSIPGIGQEEAWKRLSRVPDFAGIHRAEFDRLVEWMEFDGFLRRTSGQLVLGPKAEKQFGRFNFLDLYAVFSSPQVYTVQMQNGQEIGSLDQDFVDRLQEDTGSFVLAGRAWVVLAVRHKDRRVVVEPAPKGKRPSWGGLLPRFLGFEVCQEIKRILTQGESPPFLDEPSKLAFDRYRESISEILRSDFGIQRVDGDLYWWTFAGGLVNTTLRYALTSLDPTWKVVPDNFRIRIAEFDSSTASFLERLAPLREPEYWEDEAMWNEVAQLLPSYRFSKFQVLMPPWVERELLANSLLDLESAYRWLIGPSADAPASILEVMAATAEDEETIRQLELQSKAKEAPPLSRERGRPLEWVGSDTELEKAVEVLSGEEKIALDVETALGTKALCLVQIASQARTFLIDALSVRNLQPLQRILAASSPEKLIHNAAFASKVLGRYDLDLEYVVDTLKLSHQLRGRSIAGGHRLQAVCARELGLHFDKGQQTSDWSQRPLTIEQIESAALDAEVLLLVEHELRG